MDYLLDTDIWIHFIRKTPQYESLLNPIFADDNRLFMSIVTAGELNSFAMRNKWGKSKRKDLTILIDEVQVVPISRMEITEIYASIDTFSQGTHPTYTLPIGVSARNMGKNDLWIAATAKLLDVTLVTTDKDFDHLNGIFLPVIRLEISK